MNDTRRKLAACGAFLLPLVLVKSTAVMLGGGAPSVGSAAPQPAIGPAMLPAETLAISPSEVQLGAADHVAALRDEPFGPTPLYYPERKGEAVAPVIGPVETTPEFRINAVMASASGHVALINGKARRVGDELGETGWIVVEIVPQTRSVTIEDPRSKRRETGAVQMP